MASRFGITYRSTTSSSVRDSISTASSPPIQAVSVGVRLYDDGLKKYVHFVSSSELISLNQNSSLGQGISLSSSSSSSSFQYMAHLFTTPNPIPSMTSRL
eukprot:CAMPEP_0201604998 /NCGR_PEP_ID=MMETSP0492-20130828/4962_1 /ASSEMBLY_ACC=CAM_ASM_000837 /TAXON_ID=420259 /ORGANISM="Thalassiosira gravida, Strain GMp14c1" /LENGTH=99 /DNA_ID=CAMNT_0048069145 /DNA_START=159 /DNA_END=458 /DNA_ORIENTATION=+